jgi:membrane associated rhomboid family serine protease
MFPIWDDQVQWGYTPFWTRIFLAINVLVFFYQTSLGAGLDEFIMTRGTVPEKIMSGSGYLTLITAMFLHGWWMHLIGNMLFLYVFGDNIEARIGNTKFLLFYLAGWIAAGLIHVGFNASSPIPAVWASGAIAAVLGAYLLMFPKSRIKMIMPQTMNIFYISAQQFLLYRIWIQFFSGVWSLASSGLEWGVARWAHIWGFAFGVVMVLGRLLRR